MSARKLSPWARLYRSAQRGTGCRLTAADVQRLAFDAALMARGEADYLHGEQLDTDGGWRGNRFDSGQVARRFAVADGRRVAGAVYRRMRACWHFGEDGAGVSASH